MSPEADQYQAQSFDEHVGAMLQSVLQAHGEWATPSHMAWLHRMYSRVLLRQLELDRREQDLWQREQSLARASQATAPTTTAPAFQAKPKKSRGGKNHGQHPAPGAGGTEILSDA